MRHRFTPLNRKDSHVVQLLSGLNIGGKERAALRLAQQGIVTGQDHELWLFDTPFRSSELDFDPGSVPVRFVQRGPGLSLRFIRSLAKNLSQQGVGVIHAHNDTALCYAALACLVLQRNAPRLIATFHTWPGHETLASRLLTYRAAEQAQAVQAVSSELAERLMARHWLRQCGVIWNGVDLEQFRPGQSDTDWRAKLGIPPDSMVVVHVARFDPIKSHGVLIEAAERVHSSRRDVAFVLAGQGPLHSKVRELAQDLPFVHFVPHVSDVASLLQAADVFTLPSMHEAAPIALLEAMACACPCICTQVGGMPDMLNDGEADPCGLLIPPGDPGALAAALVRLLDDAGLRTKLGGRARRAAMQFSFEQEWRTYNQLYAGEPA